MGCAPLPAQTRRARSFRRRQQTGVARLAGGQRPGSGRRANTWSTCPAHTAAGGGGRCWCCCTAAGRRPRISPRPRESRRSPTATDGWSCCRGSRARPMPGPAGTGSTSRPAPGVAKRRSSPRRFAPCGARIACIPRRIFAAGMSAGGCLAAVLGLRYPKLFAGVAVHSAVACGAASGPMTAMQVLRARRRYADRSDRRAPRATSRRGARCRSLADRPRRRRPRRLRCATHDSSCASTWCSTVVSSAQDDGAGRAAAARP